MQKRWLLPSILCFASIVWLTWAFPRLHPAARLGLQFDRSGYLAQAAAIAAAEHVYVAGWRSYARIESHHKNQELQALTPRDPVAKEFPAAEISTNFLPRDGSKGAKVSMRPDARPLSWKLPVAATATGMPDSDAATVAMRRLAGSSTPQFALSSDARADSEGTGYKWKAGGRAPESPGLGIEASVKNGGAWQANTSFNLPENTAKDFNSYVTARIVIGVVWTILMAAGVAFPILREGAGNTARAMKDRPAVRLSCVGALLIALVGFVEWDDEMVALSAARGMFLEVVSLFLGSVFVGLLFYGALTATVLNARWHIASVRGLRLLGTRAFASRPVAAELLGGWVLAPLLLALPLLVGFVSRTPGFDSYEDGTLLSRFPVLDSILNASTQETAAVIAWAGILIPLAIRFGSRAWVRYTLLGFFAFLTFAMLDAPFRQSMAANLINAAVSGAAMLWLYSRFGILGALSGYCSAHILTAAGSLLVQPSAGLHTAGWGVLLAFAALGVVCLAATLKGPEVVAELYGDSGARVQARSRREELLAEFNVARSAQQQMLPSEPPVLTGYSISASCDPAREVGGDLYDFLPLSDGRWGIGVADVSGKGVPAALYMTLTKGLLSAASQDSADPRQILSAVNKHLRTVTKRKMFVTMALGVLDPEAKRMDYVRAGHNPVVWRRAAARETRFLSGPGIGLGIAGPVLFAKTLTTETLELGPGDALVFYSDGLTEAMNGSLEQFGEDRLAAAVEHADGMQATATRDSILEEVKQFLEGGHAQDDLTIAVLRVDSNTNGR